MADLKLTKTRIRAGIWEGVLEVDGPGNHQPDIRVTHLEKPLDGVALTEDPDKAGRFVLRIPIPADLLSDGVQSFVIWEAGRDEKLGAFAIITGEPAEDDSRTELDLLRAELDMLKRAFRRHSLETM
ncbi:MAG TPA: hypothetical protein ENK83_05710 [Aliiroseovarius sp.]|nr:hypothetical protein [Aliiroseovarius sp.]